MTFEKNAAEQKIARLLWKAAEWIDKQPGPTPPVMTAIWSPELQVAVISTAGWSVETVETPTVFEIIKPPSHVVIRLVKMPAVEVESD